MLKGIILINYLNKTSFKIDSEILDFLQKIKSDICENEVELLIVRNEDIRTLNSEYLGRDYDTDVLSFGLDYSGINITNPPLGSIVISIDKALEFAHILKHTLRDELAILFVHGILHLLGYDHEVDNGEHRDREATILRAYDIDSSLIARTK